MLLLCIFVVVVFAYIVLEHLVSFVCLFSPGRVAQSVGHLTCKSGALGSIPGLATYFRFSFSFFKKGSCQLLAKVWHEVLVNRLGGLNLTRKSVVRLTDRPDMTLDVYRGRKTTNNNNNNVCSHFVDVYIRKQEKCNNNVYMPYMFMFGSS